MRRLLFAIAVLLAAGLTGLYVTLQEMRFALAAAAILGLVEVALLLRPRAAARPAAGDPSSIAAARVAYVEEDGVLSVTLSAAAHGASHACVVLSRRLRSVANGAAQDGGPRLELAPLRGAVAGGIADAYLTPQLLRLELDAQATQAVGTPSLCVTLPAGTDQRLLERALGRILHGVPFTSDRSMPQAEAEPVPLR